MARRSYCPPTPRAWGHTDRLGRVIGGEAELPRTGLDPDDRGRIPRYAANGRDRRTPDARGQRRQARVDCDVEAAGRDDSRPSPSAEVGGSREIERSGDARVGASSDRDESGSTCAPSHIRTDGSIYPTVSSSKDFPTRRMGLGAGKSGGRSR